jgi:homoserine kinase type II
VNSNFSFTTKDGEQFFARIYEEQGREGAEAEFALLEALSARGVPVALPRKRLDGQRVHAFAGKPFAVYPFVEGEILCQGRVDESACRQVGAALARVHLASDAVPAIGAGRFRLSDLRERLGRVDASGRKDLIAAADRVRELMAQYEPKRPAGLPEGVIHGDLFRDNVLFRGGAIAALLDFESASRGVFAYDVMVTLLAWCFGDDLDAKLAGAMLRAYHEVRPLMDAERAALPLEGAIVCLRFATTRLTDFSLRVPEGVAPGRHYGRFLARLEALERGALAEILASL